MKHFKQVLYKEQGQSFGHLLVGTSPPVGRTFRKRAILRREWFFFYAFPTVFWEQNEQN